MKQRDYVPFGTRTATSKNTWKLTRWEEGQCWRKKFGKGHVSVGAGCSLLVVFSYGPNSDNSYSSTRWDYDRPVITEGEAMTMVDEGKGRIMAGREPGWVSTPQLTGKDRLRIT